MLKHVFTKFIILSFILSEMNSPLFVSFVFFVVTYSHDLLFVVDSLECQIFRQWLSLKEKAGQINQRKNNLFISFFLSAFLHSIKCSFFSRHSSVHFHSIFISILMFFSAILSSAFRDLSPAGLCGFLLSSKINIWFDLFLFEFIWYALFPNSVVYLYSARNAVKGPSLKLSAFKKSVAVVANSAIRRFCPMIIQISFSTFPQMQHYFENYLHCSFTQTKFLVVFVFILNPFSAWFT